MTAPAPAADEAANLWQTEKAALEKARDEALAKLKVSILFPTLLGSNVSCSR